MPRTDAREFQDVIEVVDELLRERPTIESWFARRKDSLTTVVRDSVDKNTFRAFHHMPNKPSEAFRKWANEEFAKADTLKALGGIASQANYDEWIRQLSAKLNQFWQNLMGQEIPFGPRRKLPNLLLKEIVLWTGISDSLRAQLIGWLHVPLDSYTLSAIRNCIHDFKIPKNATMSYVSSESMYDQIQLIIRETVASSRLPAIYFDNLAWNIRH